MDGMPMSHNHTNMSMPISPNYNSNQTTMAMDGTTMMHMAFFWGKDVTILFDGWPGGGRLGMYILALAAVFLLAAAAEVLPVAPISKPRAAAAAVTSAAVHGVRMALAYLVMLSVMSFNVGVFVAAVAGHATGRFVVKYREFPAGTAAVHC